MTTYATFADFNADVEAARAAYYADEAVRAGLCAVCKHRKKDAPRYRRCKACRTAGRAAA